MNGRRGEVGSRPGTGDVKDRRGRGKGMFGVDSTISLAIHLRLSPPVSPPFAQNALLGQVSNMTGNCVSVSSKEKAEMSDNER
jgi:hypothetical protein